jgi:RimJ/RimL family protein N-acetyltransferase
MSYELLAQAPARTHGAYAVRAIALQDMEPVRNWRNAQMAVLRQASPISSAQQQRYFEQAIQPTFAEPHPRQVLLTLLLDGAPVAYGGLTNVDWDARRAELSFLAAPERAADIEGYEQDFRAFLALAIDGIAFGDLRLHRVFAETYDIRPHHVAILESFGFVAEGRMRDHVRINDRYVDSLVHGYVAR